MVRPLRGCRLACERRLDAQRAQLEDAASAAALNLNTSQIADGRLGIALALPAGRVFQKGTQGILRVNFTLTDARRARRAGAAFANAPVRKEVVDMNAKPVPAIFPISQMRFRPSSAAQ